MTRLLRIAVRALAATALLIIVVALIVFADSNRILSKQYPFPQHAAFVVPQADSAMVARGMHLAGPIAKCTDCHGQTLSGRMFIDNAAFGRYLGPNLTRGTGGLAARLTDSDWELAIRHGIDRHGRGLLFMPSRNYNRFSDEDLADLIAYVKQVPPVDNTTATSQVGPVGRVLLVAGKARLVDATEIDQQLPHAPAPEIGPTPAYGAYLARVGSCLGCHRSNLEGGHVVGAPPSFKPAANLTPTGIGTWTKADFVRALRQGLLPGGVPIDSFMPFRATKDMNDTEIDALWAYLQTVPPQPIGK
jgi:mono/diheme cytochrome c family protein